MSAKPRHPQQRPRRAAALVVQWRDVCRRAWRALSQDDRHLPLGTRGERAAKRYLQRRRLKIVEESVQIQGGEIDLIAVDGKTVVFVEVKTRVDHRRGHPAEAVDLPKQRQLARLALVYMKRHDLLDTPARFDVVAVTWPHDARRPMIEHIRDAFEAPEASW